LATFKGIAFPFRKGASSFPEKVEDEELIRQSIIQILLTARNERLMRPSFGSGVMAVVFENNGVTLAHKLEAEVLSSLGKYEPRIIVLSVQTASPNDNEILITVSYAIVATKRQDSVSLSLATSQ
jgi:phage baseplate assembly protein W